MCCHNRFSVVVNQMDEWMSERWAVSKAIYHNKINKPIFLWLMDWGQMLGFKGSPRLWCSTSSSTPWGLHYNLGSLHNFTWLSCHTCSKRSLDACCRVVCPIVWKLICFITKRNSFSCTCDWSTDQWKWINDGVLEKWFKDPINLYYLTGASIHENQLTPKRIFINEALSNPPHPHIQREIKEIR